MFKTLAQLFIIFIAVYIFLHSWGKDGFDPGEGVIALTTTTIHQTRLAECRLDQVAAKRDGIDCFQEYYAPQD